MFNKIDKILDRRRFFRWRPAAVLRISGEDAQTFLQGQFTNDLRRGRADAGVYGLWLNHKGKVLADSFVVSAGTSDYWLWSYFSPGAEIRSRLETFIIADDVHIEDETPRWAGVAVFDQGSSLPPPTVVAQTFVGRRALHANAEWLYQVSPENEFALSVALAGATELTRYEMEYLRIAAGIPAVPVDIGNTELPNEGGLEEVAISFTKGCYLGQEVMARLRTMGQVRRRIRRVRSRDVGAPATLPAALFAGEQRVGELRSAVAVDGGFIGLALVGLLQLKADVRLAFTVGEATPSIEILE